MSNWHIDSLDARAGLCFASYRNPDLNAKFEDGPGIFLGPPTFEPESLASRVMGLSAARGSFQLGLFTDAGEVGFPTLDDLTEFVRRCYGGGSGGDAAEGGGGPPPPNPESGEPPEFPPFDGYNSAMFLAKAISEFSHKSESRDFSKGTEPDQMQIAKVEWLANFTGSVITQTKSETDILANAGLRIAGELFSRFQASQRNPETLLSWHLSMRSLGAAFSRQHLWPTIVERKRLLALRSACQPFMRSFEAKYRGLRFSEHEPALAVFLWCLLHAATGIELYSFSQLGFPDFDPPFHPLSPDSRFLDFALEQLALPPNVLTYSFDLLSMDPLEQVSMWPVSKDLLPNVDTANSAIGTIVKAENMSVLELMSICFATPSELLRSSSTVKLIELVNFGSAHVVAMSESSHLISPERFPNNTTNRTLVWIADQMPKRVLPEFLEEMIGTVKTKRY